MPTAGTEPVTRAFASQPEQRSNPFLYPKITLRKVYDEARRGFPDCDDVILWNEAGAVSETTMANSVIEKEGRLVTPLVQCALLRGVLRHLLPREGVINEAPIPLERLRPATRIYLINSVPR